MDKIFSSIKLNSGGKVYCKPEWNWDTSLSKWNDFDLWTVISGKGYMFTEDRNFKLAAGDCFLLRDEKRYLMSTVAEDPIAVIYIHFNFLDSKGAQFRPDEKDLPNLHRRIYNFPFFLQILEKILQYKRRNAYDIAAEWLKAAFLEIYSNDSKLLSPDPGKTATKVRHYFEKIAEHPEGNYSINEIAEEIGCSRDHFSREFKKYAGDTFKDFCLNSKIERAKLYLNSTDYPVSKISESIGYSDFGFFCRQFKNKTGSSPLKYRQSLKKSVNS